MPKSTHGFENAVLTAPSVAPGLPYDSLLREFNSRFEMLNADTPELVRQAQKIRHQVYCVENGFEKSSEDSEGFETDEFDSHAVQSVLVARETAAALGTVRLIMPLAHAPERSFAVQRLLDPSSARRLLSLPVHTMAEASRFSISRHFRRLMTYSDRWETEGGDEQFRSDDAPGVVPGAREDEPAARHNPLVRVDGANLDPHVFGYVDSISADRLSGGVPWLASALLHRRICDAECRDARTPGLLADYQRRRFVEGAPVAAAWRGATEFGAAH